MNAAARFLYGMLAAALSAASSAAAFTPLGVPGSRLAALSADGCVAAGDVSGGDAGGFRWSAADGVRRLDAAISVRALSANGRYAAGSSLDAEQREVASWWDADGGVHRLGGAPGVDAISVVSQAFGVTDQLQIVGGLGGAASAFVWSPDAGMRVLPVPDGDTAARAHGVGDDGAIVYGWTESRDGRRRGATWAAGAPRILSDAAGRSVRDIVAANRSAHVLVGLLDDGGAYRWTARSGVVPSPPAPHDAAPLQWFASSDDGGVVVGSAGSGDARRAMVWTADATIAPLDRWLAARGVAIPRDWQLAAATAVTGDGGRIAGWGLHDGRFDSFVVELPSADGKLRACGVAASAPAASPQAGAPYSQ